MYISWYYKQINSNYWIVTWEDSKEYFIFKNDRANAFNWDFVKIKIFKEAVEWKKAEAEIIKINSRTKEDLVWIFQKPKDKTFGFVRIYNTFWWKDVFIWEKDASWAKNNDVVIIYIAWWIDKPYWVVKKVLWNRNSAWIDETIVLYEKNVRLDFSSEVKKEVTYMKPFSDFGKRLDLTDELIVTIDWADAKDLDDAVSVKILPNNNYELWVHIADVTHYVREKSHLDKEAVKRWTSIYLPWKVIPMLPSELSNWLCSLHPGEPKATLSIIMEIDKDSSKVVNKKIVESFIKSKARLTYDEVWGIIKDWESWEKYDNELMQMLNLAFNLKKKIYARRKKEWKIEFEFWETKIEIWDKWEVKKIYKLERNEAHRIIEEFMIIANEEISRFFAEKKIPFLYRVHEKPGEDSILTLKNILESNWIFLDIKNINPLVISQIIDSLKWKSEQYFLTKQILQSMAKAKYMDEVLWHFGLSLRYYSHFTSPIRRYPDLQIHRIIKEYLNWNLTKDKIKNYKENLSKIAKLSSTNEQKAEEVEDKIKFLKVIEYMQDKVWMRFNWIISWISPIWIYVELENWVEWFIHKKTFDLVFDEDNKCFIETSANIKYWIWKNIKIEVSRADKKLWFLDFLIAK